MHDHEQEEEKTNINTIPIANFKSSKLTQMSKRTREEEVKQMKNSGKDEPMSPSKFNGVRLPNKL